MSNTSWIPMKLGLLESSIPKFVLENSGPPVVAVPGPILRRGQRLFNHGSTVRGDDRIHVSKFSEFKGYDFRNCFSIISPNQIRPAASAVLIAPNVILTANHFRKANLLRSSWQAINRLNVNEGNRFNFKSIPPLKILKEDLETLILEKSFNIPFAEFASTQEINQTKAGLIVGYGNDQRGISGIKRELKVKIELCSENFNNVRFNCNSKQHLIVKADPEEGTGQTDGINPRDSGCPLYINVRGKVKLAGIASMSLNNGQAGLFIRVDTYKAEIDKIIQRFKEN